MPKTGFITEDDVNRLQIRQKELFHNPGPSRPIKGAVYDIGEIGRDEDTKYYSAKRKEIHIKLMTETLALAERAEARRQQKAMK
jgi:hypothetical protein